jgi:hypothetical protein
MIPSLQLNGFCHQLKFVPEPFGEHTHVSLGVSDFRPEVRPQDGHLFAHALCHFRDDLANLSQ